MRTRIYSSFIGAILMFMASASLCPAARDHADGGRGDRGAGDLGLRSKKRS